MKTLVIIIVIVIVTVAGAVGVQAAEISLSELVELFIALEIIPQEKASQARAVVLSQRTQPLQKLLFTRDLALGDSGEDVLRLQKLLNTSPITKVALSGAGSLGNETTYFGVLTKGAVSRFQELFYKEILAPLGLSHGFGIFGPSTRKKLNEIVNAGGDIPNVRPIITVPNEGESGETPLFVESIDNTSTSAKSIFAFESDTPIIFYPTHYSGLPGTRVTLTGAGFTPQGNTILFGSTVIRNISTPDSSRLVFTVPNATSGKHTILVSNALGKSNEAFFIITKPSATPPTIAYITPTFGYGRTSVIVHGSGFSLTGNTVFTGYTNFENVSSADGKNIVLSLLPPNEGVNFDPAKDLEGEGRNITTYENRASLITDISEAIWIYIGNENGISNGVPFDYFYDKNSF